MTLNKASPIPLYYQLAELLREQIRTGDLKSGDQLPPERVLSEQHGISRMTARQAIGYLLRDGSLVTKHGLGTFVAEPKLTYDAFHLLSFTEEVVQRGGRAVSQVLEQHVIAAPPQAVRELALAPEALVVKIVRLRLSDAVPLVIETTFVPALRCPNLEHENLTDRSLYNVFDHVYGITLKRARQTLEATVANAYERDLFSVPLDMPMILLEGVTSDEYDRPVEYFKAVYRGDRFKFAYESERSAFASSASMPRLSILLA